jgi:hypothetical protein
LTAPQEAAVVTEANSAEAGMPKRVSLPSMLPGPKRAARPASGWAALRVHQHQRQHHEQECHRGQMAQPWRRSPTSTETEAQRGRDQEDGQHLQEVGQRRRVLIRVRRVGVEEAAAVGAEHLDGFLRGHRPHGQGLLVGALRFGHRFALGILQGWPAASSLGTV